MATTHLPLPISSPFLNCFVTSLKLATNVYSLIWPLSYAKIKLQNPAIKTPAIKINYLAPLANRTIRTSNAA